MLRDGLTSEFPSATAFIARIWPPTIPRETWLWAALSGLGASFVASALLGLALVALRYADGRDPAAYAASIIAIATTAIGLAVAWRAGGGRAVAAYLGLHLAYSLAALPGIVLFCDRSGESNCFARFAIGQWRAAAGILAAIPLAATMRTGKAAHGALFPAAGCFVAVSQLLLVPVALVSFGLISLPRASTEADLQSVYLLLVMVAAAAVAGAVLAVRRARVHEAATLAALILLGSVSGLLSLLVAFSEPTSVMRVVGLLMPGSEVVALLVAWSVVRRRIHAVTAG